MKRYRLLLLGLAVFVAIFFLASASALADEEPVHVVEPGESLSKIARQYRVTVPELVELNGIENPNLIYVGQRLRIGSVEDLLAENKPIISDQPWWGRVIVASTPIRPAPKNSGYLSDPKRLSLRTTLYAGDTVQVIKTVEGERVIANNDKWYKIEAEEEQYVYSAYVKPRKLRSYLRWAEWRIGRSGLGSTSRSSWRWPTRMERPSTLRWSPRGSSFPPPKGSIISMVTGVQPIGVWWAEKRAPPVSSIFPR